MRVRPWEEHGPGVFEDADAGMARRVDRGLVGMKQELLTLVELLQTLGGIAVPADPERTAAQTGLLLESLYQGLDIQRIKCTLELGAPEVPSKGSILQ